MTRHPNLSEIRMIPGRKGIAFVEYDDENSASTARDALHNTKLHGVTAGQEEMRMKVSFAKQ